MPGSSIRFPFLRSASIHPAPTPDHIASATRSDEPPGSAGGGSVLGGLRELNQTSRRPSAGESTGDFRSTRVRTNAVPSSEPVAAATSVHRPELPNLSKSDLRPGDILFLLDEPGNSCATHRAIVTGQALAGMSLLRKNKGDSQLVHAVIWTKAKSNPGKSEPLDKGEPEIAEMRGGDRLSAQSTALRQGLYRVYRPIDENVGDWVAQISMVWSDNRSIPYSKPKSVQSVLRNSTFGPKAAARSDQYAVEAFDPSPAWGDRGSFCSSFILAAYQAATLRTGNELSGALKADAESTSVRTLEHFIKSSSDQFTALGHIRVKPEDVLYQE